MREIDLRIFWHNVKRKRKMRKVTQADIAKRLGITQPSYNRYENLESNTLTDDMVNTLCSILECTKEDLTGHVEISIAHYPEEVQEWISSKDGFVYVMKAYDEYKEKEKMFNYYKGL